jgi:Fe-S cluster assembly scaffold protein SufB
VDREEAGEFVSVGVDIMEADRIGTFIQKDSSVIHSRSSQEGVEVSGISQAIDTHDGLEAYLWKNVSPDTDAFTSHALKTPHEGYFIRARQGVKAANPVQSCLYISTNGFAQNVHNIVVAEENSELHIITGCATAAHLTSGLHVGVSEIYIKKNARLTFTMIHDWGEKIAVGPVR